MTLSSYLAKSYLCVFISCLTIFHMSNKVTQESHPSTILNIAIVVLSSLVLSVSVGTILGFILEPDRIFRTLIYTSSISIIVSFTVGYLYSKFLSILKEKDQKITFKDKLILQKELSASQTQLKLTEEILRNQLVITSEKNKIIQELSRHQKPEYEIERDILGLSDMSLLTEKDWRVFQVKFNSYFPNFFDKFMKIVPIYSEADKRLACLIKLNLSNQEMAYMLGVSPESVYKAKYRLKKKTNIENIKSLEDFIKKI